LESNSGLTISLLQENNPTIVRLIAAIFKLRAAEYLKKGFMLT